MDIAKKKRWYDSSSEDEKRPMDDTLDTLKNFKKASSLECAMCQYAVEFEPTDPYNTKRHVWKFFRLYMWYFLLITFCSILLRD